MRPTQGAAVRGNRPPAAKARLSITRPKWALDSVASVPKSRRPRPLMRLASAELDRGVGNGHRTPLGEAIRWLVRPKTPAFGDGTPGRRVARRQRSWRRRDAWARFGGPSSGDWSAEGGLEGPRLESFRPPLAGIPWGTCPPDIRGVLYSISRRAVSPGPAALRRNLLDRGSRSAPSPLPAFTLLQLQ